MATPDGPARKDPASGKFSSTSGQGSWQRAMREASSYIGLGVQLALTMGFFVGAGYLLDRWLGTSPWLLIGGAVLGMVAIFIMLFRLVDELNKKSAADRKARES